MMMNFLDLSAASEEERRLIREILSDTSIVNIAEPQQNQIPQQPASQFVVAPNKNLHHRFEAPNNALNNTSSNNNFNSRQAYQQQHHHTARQTTATATTTTTLSTLTSSGSKSQHPTNTTLTNENSNPQHQHDQHPAQTTASLNTNSNSNTSINSVVNSGAGTGARSTNTSTSSIIDKVSQSPARATTSSQSDVKIAIDKPQPATPSNQNNSRFPFQTIAPSTNQNSFETSEAEDVKPAVVSQLSSTTSVVSDVNTNNAQQQHSNNPQMHHQHMNGQRHTYKNSPNNNHMNYSVNSSNAHNNNNSISGNSTAATLAHRNNYSSQRKNIHNTSNNITNSIGNNSGNSIRNTRVPSLSNVATVIGSAQQQHYPQQQYTPPLPSNSSSTHFHSMNVNNINNHSANAINSQLNHHQRTNEHTNDRLRSGLTNHMNSNNEVNNIAVNNIAVTSTSNLAPIPSNLDQHHTMPLNMYNHHTAHLHHQVPSIMPTAKLDPKNSNLKSQAYHPQDTSSSMNNTTGNQSVPPTAQMPPMAGDINSVISMDMTSTQPQSYAIPPHVTAFGPPPHHVYSGAPIFQPYYHLIPYNLPSYVPYVIPPNSVVPSRQQVPLQSNHSPHSNSPNSHSRHISQQQQNHEQYNNAIVTSPTNQQNVKDIKDHIRDPDISCQYNKKDNIEKEDSERNSTDSKIPANNSLSADKLLTQVKDISRSSQESESLNHKEIQSEVNMISQDSSSIDQKNINKMTNLVPKASSINKNCSLTTNKNKNIVPITKGERIETQVQKPELDPTVSNSTNKNLITNKTAGFENNRITTKQQDGRAPPTTVNASTRDDMVKVSSNEDSETASTLDISKQSLESSPNCDQSKSSEISNKFTTDTCSPVESTEIPEAKLLGEFSQRNSGPASSKSWADLFKRGGSVALGSSINGEADNNNLGTDNADEENRLRKSSSNMVEGSLKLNGHAVTTIEQRNQEAVRRALDSMAPRLAQKIGSINLKHALPFLKPRGFINKGNGCYINATLQALIACPPFYNLMKEIGDLRCFRRDNSSTPILDSFAELFLNFPPLDASKKNKQLTSPDQKMHISNLQAEAIEPRCIYNVLGQIKSECLKGAQEDAEEFLSSVLNGLHEEMISLNEVPQDSINHDGHPSDVEDSNEDITNDDNLWREVGSKNRSLPIRTAKVINTPIQEIFGGSLFSIRTAGKDRCGHRSPFFDLQLDISGDNVKSVQDAIKSFTATEVIHDFYCSKTKQKLDAQRRTSLDQLPPILILHLKQFVYTQDHGLKKLIKKIDYPIDFELPENCLHEKNSSDRNLLTSRSYKLLAVVYHDGKEAIKGHYLTDVYHIGSNQWIRCDDSNLRVIPAPRIENTEATHRTPYLLFYRRLNTLRAQTSNYDNKKKN